MNAVLSDGRVRVYQLKEPTYSEADLAIGLESHHTLSMHDCQTGAINKLQLSVDGKFLVSCGLDGNIFSYEVVPPEEVKLREFKEEPIDQVLNLTPRLQKKTTSVATCIQMDEILFNWFHFTIPYLAKKRYSCFFNRGKPLLKKNLFLI